MSKAVVNHVYLHKNTGNYYLILHIGLHVENEEELVVYKRIDKVKDNIWIRPRSEFEKECRFTDVLPEV